MATEITMPKLGLTMKVGRIGKWLKKEGDPVKKGEAIAEVLTDKIANVLEAAAEGILLKIAAPVGAQLPVGGLMGCAVILLLKRSGALDRMLEQLKR